MTSLPLFLSLYSLSANTFSLLSLQSDEDPVDPLPKFREQCVSKCPDYKQKYDACVKRIEQKGEGDCEAWYFELVHCVDNCALPKVFRTLKGE